MIDILTIQGRSYLAAINSMTLVDPEYRWIVVTTSGSNGRLLFGGIGGGGGGGNAHKKRRMDTSDVSMFDDDLANGKKNKMHELLKISERASSLTFLFSSQATESMDLSSSTSSIISIDDMKLEYSVCLAKLNLTEKFPDLEFSSRNTSSLSSSTSTTSASMITKFSSTVASDCVALFTRCGMFDAALSLSVQHGLSLMPIFEALANRAAKSIIQQNDGR